jgi:2-polyprenyl-3-methyl-5-hydroxy-6-metoxy-1,4-benzoquinol methylase
MFKDGEYVIINQSAKKGLPDQVGKTVKVLYEIFDSPNYDYHVETFDHTLLPVRESELSKYPIDTNHVAYHKPTEEIVEVVQIDYENNQVEIRFSDEGMTVVDLNTLEKVENEGVIMVEKAGYFQEKGHKLGKLVDEKQAAYGDSVTKASQLMKVFLQDYKTTKGYLIPEELLDHILLQVRIIDKQNRIFSNPKADKMNESPYDDISGYGLLGGRMQGELK